MELAGEIAVLWWLMAWHGRLRAAILLSWGFCKALVRHGLWGRNRRGLALFWQNYGPERLVALRAAERHQLPLTGHCIACGLCDVGLTNQAGANLQLMEAVLSSTRSLPDYDAAAETWSQVADAVLAAKEQECPTQVPLRMVKRLVLQKAADIAERPGANPPKNT